MGNRTGATAARNAAPPLPWWSLFDQYQAERICDAVRIAITNQLLDNSPVAWFAGIIRKELLNPLDAYMLENSDSDIVGVTIEVQKAMELFDKGERLAELCEDEWQFSEGDGKHYGKDLYASWIEFIAVGAGPYVSWGIPRASEKASRSASLPRGNAAELTVERVLDFMRERGLQSLSDAQAEEVAALYPAERNGRPATVRTVRRRLTTARKLGMLPPK